MIKNPSLIPDRPLKADEDFGMTLLDHFAGHALTGLLASGQFTEREYRGIATQAYDQADAMLRQRPIMLEYIQRERARALGQKTPGVPSP